MTRESRFRRKYLCRVHAVQLADGEDLLDPVEVVMTEAQRRADAKTMGEDAA